MNACIATTTELDGQSQWQAGIIQNAVASVLYNAHRIQFNALAVTRSFSPQSSAPISVMSLFLFA
jgi:hypothetical protein